jgi:chromosome segregation ATPase
MAETDRITRLSPVRRCLNAGLLLALTGAALTLVSCDDSDTRSTIAKASNQLRIAPALGVDDEGNDRMADGYAQAASIAQGAQAAGAGLVAGNAAAAKAQIDLKAAINAIEGITGRTTSGQALLLRLANEQSRLADLQAFDPSPERAQISSRRAEIQQGIRAAEAQLAELEGMIESVTKAIQDQRSQARAKRDAAEDLRERAINIGGVQRATLIEQSNARQREADAFEQQAALLGLQLEKLGYARKAGEEQRDGLRRQLEELMQRERRLEAEVASRAQQASDARQNIADLSSRVSSQINEIAQWYNDAIAPNLAEAISGFESAAARARQDQNSAGSAARLLIGTSEHALASVHRAHAGLLDNMLSFVDLAIARGVNAQPIKAIQTELRAKRNEASAAADAAAEQSASSLSGAGAPGTAGQLLSELAEKIRPAGSVRNGAASHDDHDHGHDHDHDGDHDHDDDGEHGFHGEQGFDGE